MTKTLLIVAAAAVAITVGSPASAAITSNGSGQNGLLTNGAGDNGRFINGVSANGAGDNGQFVNGVSAAGQRLAIDACEAERVERCQPRAGLRVLNVVLPTTAGAMSRGGSTKGTGGMNGVSSNGFAKR